MQAARSAKWTFLSNHSHVLIYLAQNPDARLRDLAEAVGITERFAHQIVADLTAAGYLQSSPQGRRKTYRVNDELSFRHPLEQGAQIKHLLEIFTPEPTTEKESN
jgi:DNA-binding MarR family transcriptional regulator